MRIDGHIDTQSRYIEGFLAGQAVAYCEMVCRGVRLAGQMDVAIEATKLLVALVEREGCQSRVVVGDDPNRCALWIYRDERVAGIIDAVAARASPTPSAVDIWGVGKLFGYGDHAILEFLAR